MKIRIWSDYKMKSSHLYNIILKYKLIQLSGFFRHCLKVYSSLINLSWDISVDQRALDNYFVIVQNLILVPTYDRSKDQTQDL